jgi:hypothetical protein
VRWNIQVRGQKAAWALPQLRVSGRWRQLDFVALQSDLNLIAPTQAQRSAQILGNHHSSGTINGSFHAINYTVAIAQAAVISIVVRLPRNGNRRVN